MRFYTVQAAADLLGVKKKGFFRWLRAHGFLSKHNLPRELFIQRGLFQISHRKWIHPSTGSEHISSRTLLTQKGVAYFDELLRQQAPQALRLRNRSAANEGTASASTGERTATPEGVSKNARDEHICTTEPNKMSLIQSVIHNWKNIRRSAVIIDLDTTGLGSDAELIEISIIDSKGNTLLDTLVQPHSHDIPASATAIHGISNNDVQGAPYWSDIYREARQIMHQRHVITYNAAFERRILDQTCRAYGLQQTNFWQSSFMCAMESYADYRKVPCPKHGYKWHKLSDAARHEGLELPNNLHRSLADAQLTLALIDRAYDQLQNQQSGATA